MGKTSSRELLRQRKWKRISLSWEGESKRRLRRRRTEKRRPLKLVSVWQTQMPVEEEADVDEGIATEEEVVDRVIVVAEDVVAVVEGVQRTQVSTFKTEQLFHLCRWYQLLGVL